MGRICRSFCCFAALTSILAKIGITGVESNLGTAIRTGVVLVMAWVIVFMKGKQTQLKILDKRSCSTYPSRTCHRRIMAMLLLRHTKRQGQRGRAIDKMSIVVTVILSYLVFRRS